MPERRVVVVGTTADYIDIINKRWPRRALFVTAARERADAREAAPDRSDEVLVDLTRPDEVEGALVSHLSRHDLQPSGIVAFDCESMALAARLAARFDLPYPSLDAIQLTRSKHASKARWREKGVPCPAVALVREEAEAESFLAEVGRPIVLKPLTGSGSELTFQCSDADACRIAFRQLKSGMAARAGSRMYDRWSHTSIELDPREIFTAEEFVDGPEYSADFIVQGDDVTVVRVAQKIRRPAPPFGITLAYLLPGELPAGLTPEILGRYFRDAAHGLGLTCALCMVDFIVCDSAPVFIELTPRPGGDCLPPLIRRCCGLDMLRLALDFAESDPLRIPAPGGWERLVGVRLFARESGIISRLDTERIIADPCVVECYLKRRPGDRVTLPPENYDSWLLGHVIFRPTLQDIAAQCAEITTKLEVVMEADHDRNVHGVHTADRRIAPAADPAS